MTATDGYFAAGAILQIAGVGEVVWEVSRARRQFGRARLVVRAARWLAQQIQRQFRRPRIAQLAAHTAGVSNVTVATDVHRAGAPTPSLEEQVAQLKHDVTELREALELQKKRLDNLDQAASATAEALGELRAGLSATSDRLHQLIGDIATGGLRLVGAAMIVTGIAFEAWPWWWTDRPVVAVVVFAGLVVATL